MNQHGREQRCHHRTRSDDHPTHGPAHIFEPHENEQVVAQHAESEQSQHPQIRFGQLGPGALLPPPRGQENRHPADVTQNRCLDGRERPKGHFLRHDRATPQSCREHDRPICQAGGGCLWDFTINEDVDPIHSGLYWLTHSLQISTLRHGVAGLRKTRHDHDSPRIRQFPSRHGAIRIIERKVKGKSFFITRVIATGMGGPSAARANTNRVSVGETFVGQVWRKGDPPADRK